MHVLEHQVIPRIFAILPSSIAPDNDSCIAIVVTPLLNKSNMAIGFFNPCDFFAYNNDPSSPAYNPTSNNSDILYVGLPVDTAASPYSAQSIAATVAHEYQHLVRFSRKTYMRFLAGETNPLREDSSFDEGMSHLAESLCGLGLSGGNLRFVQRWLAHPSAYSLRYNDLDGASDSAGKRGGNAAFFYWLFMRAGGAEFSSTGAGTVLDKGGIAFINRTIESGYTGWNSLAHIFGEDASSLFLRYVCDINAGIQTPACIFDPYTGEPISIFAGMGNFTTLDGGSISLATVPRFPMERSIVLPAFSVGFYEAIPLNEKTAYYFSAEDLGSAPCAAAAYYWMQ